MRIYRLIYLAQVAALWGECSWIQEDGKIYVSLDGKSSGLIFSISTHLFN